MFYREFHEKLAPFKMAAISHFPNESEAKLPSAVTLLARTENIFGAFSQAAVKGGGEKRPTNQQSKNGQLVGVEGEKKPICASTPGRRCLGQLPFLPTPRTSHGWLPPMTL